MTDAFPGRLNETEGSVPPVLLNAALAVVREIARETQWGTSGKVVDSHEEQQRVLAAVLPLHEQQVRERIAEALKRISNDREAAAHECADERYHPLMGESGAYWNAARLIREGKEQDGDDG